MKKLNVLMALAMSVPLHGQTLTEAGYILPMDQLPVHVSAYQPSTGGMDMTWDYSDLVEDSSFVVEFDLPDATPSGLNFPMATAVEIRSGNFPGVEYRYFELNVDGWYEHGYATDLGTIVYSDSAGMPDPLTVLEFPCVYTDAWTDQEGDLFEGIWAITEVDGFGTLEMPYGTIANVLRVNTYRAYYSWWADYPYSYTTSFYKPGIGAPILETIESGHTSGGSSSYALKWIDVSIATGVEESDLQVIGIDLYPNPSSSTSQVVFGTCGGVSIELIDRAGRVVSMEDLGTLPPGIHTHTLDLCGLAAGQYTVHVLNELNEHGVERLVIQ